MAEIGDVLIRRKAAEGPSKIRLVGIAEAGFVAEPVDEFGSPFVVSANELVADYGSKAPSLPPDEQTLLRQADAEATARANRAYGRRFKQVTEHPEPHPDSPEGRFRAEAKQ